MSVQFTLIHNEDGEKNIAVFVSGQAPSVAHESHPNFDAIVELALLGDEAVIDLFDIAATVGAKFNQLSERVSTRNGRMYLDGVEVDNSLTEQVLRFMEAGIDDWKPLVAFFENVQANPNEHSREQLFTWLSNEAFTLSRSGYIVAYKGVRPTDDGFESINSGRAIVNGEVKTGKIPQTFGDIVTMPRDEVEWNPAVGCHQGLHVGTYDYANGFAQGALLEVHVNPRDVVSVPTDCSWAKVRCCRYQVVGVIDAPYTLPVLDYSGYGDMDEWGDGEYDDGF